MEIPDELSCTVKFTPEIYLPEIYPIDINPSLPTFIYNYYNLDPLWHQHEHGNRVLLIEPEFFKQYPVSKQCIDFMLALCKNIPGMQIYVGSFQSFRQDYLTPAIYYKEHPFNAHYSGIKESRAWVSENISEYYPSFFSYWKKLEKELLKNLF
jgi:deoxyribodipyrimidine photo-lyase